MTELAISRGITGRNFVALTYDDGPVYPEATRQIVDEVRNRGGRATFFVRGCMAAINPEVIRYIHAAGMEIGNHTFNHQRLGLFDPNHAASTSVIKDEIKRTHDLVEELTGASMRTFRAPWGHLNEFVKKTITDDPVLRPLNYKAVRWSVDTKDYSEGQDADSMLRIVENEPDLDGAIVLMHDGADRFYKVRARPTVEATAKLVPLLIDRGFVLVTVSEIIDGLN